MSLGRLLLLLLLLLLLCTLPLASSWCRVLACLCLTIIRLPLL
jgi:hypothetical protein